RLRREVPLISRVMHGEHDADPSIADVTGEKRAEIDGCERGVRVVRVKDDGIAPANPRNGGERRHAEACITTRIVRIVRARRAVEIRPVEILGVLDKIPLGADTRIVRTLRQSPEPCWFDAAADLDAERGTDWLD